MRDAAERASVEEALFVELSEAMHQCGVSAHRLEDAMRQVGAALQIEAEVFATPTMLLVSSHGQTRLLRVSPSEIALGRLAAVDAVAVWLGRGVLSPAEALVRLRAIMQAPPRFSSTAVIAAFGVLSASASVFFGGGWWTLIAAGLQGLGVGWAALVLPRRPHTARVSTLLLAFLTAVSAAAASTVAPIDQLSLTLAALIVLLPGFSLTVALAELSAGHLAAGSARLSGVAVTFLHLTVGAAAGWALFEGGVEPEPTIPWMLEPIVIAASAISLGVLFQARSRDFSVILAACAVAVYAARGLTVCLNPMAGAFGAALAVGVYSNVQARVRDVPASIALMPGILLLVPGSVGFRGMGALMDHQTLDGVHTAFTTVVTAAALVAGLLVANAISPARREL